MRKIKLIVMDRPINNLTDLLSSIKAKREEARRVEFPEPWCFRGTEEDRNYPLKPKIGCEQSYGGMNIEFNEDQEKKLLHRFRRFAYAHLPPGAGEWEALFLARHYGLPTRIMDWTMSPLIAAYFATASLTAKKPKGVIWGILRQPIENYEINVLKPEEDQIDLIPRDRPAVKLIYPVYNSDRIIAQKGIFSWHSNPDESLDSQINKDFEDKHLDINWLVKWQLDFSDDDIKQSNQLINSFLMELEWLGVSQRTIFPDLSGIAKGLWQTELLFHGKLSG